MNYKKSFLTWLLVCTLTISNACTTFFINHNGQMVFGRNYDWMAVSGMVCTNQKGLHKSSIKNEDGPSISWVSQYGSISFNQYGKEFPTGGMNEKGLVVELMWLDGTKYPAPDDRASLETLQWVQYQLDNSATIEEVLASDKKIRISTSGVPLHYLVADANGQAATVEFLDGKMVVHKGSNLPLPVLTNETYDVSIKNRYKDNKNNSQERFTKACALIQEYKSTATNKLSLVDQSFSILNQVSQGDYTKWSIVYDITNKKIYFKTEQSPQVRHLVFSSFDFTCLRPSRALNMNGPEKGDISGKMAVYTEALNRQIFEKSMEQSASQIQLTNQQKESILAYPDAIKCQ